VNIVWRISGNLFFFLLLFSVFDKNGECASKNSSSNIRYLSQNLIDTSIQRGFFLLNESADMAGVGFRHQRSIKEAKKIVHSLKQRAKGDPNEKYILWKVGELEAQIYLEESDLIWQQMQKRQLTINELVDKYNKEVGKWRPDFATLYRIHKNMDQVDVNKANELADSYNQRKRAISREAVYFLEKALLEGNVEKARKEVGYCLRNQLYLDISQSKYKRLEDRVEGLLHAQEEKPHISQSVRTADMLLKHKKITEARKTLDSAQNKLNTIKKHLPQREAISITSTLKRAFGRLGALEDSLVNVNITILRTQGVDAADKYLQSVLRVFGVSREKAASVDRMIISVNSPEDNAMRSEIAGLETEDNEEKSQVLDDIMFAAKKKAKEKMDSLQAIENARLWQLQQERARRDSIAQVARAKQEAALRAKQLRADSLAMAVYLKREKNDMRAAKKIFTKDRAYLQQYLGSDELSMLETTIKQFASPPVEQKSEVTYLERVKKTKTTSQPRQVASTSSPSRSMSLNENVERAQKETMGIYSMLEKNDINKAYRRFQINRTPLQKYLAPEVFSMLEMTVTQAYQYNTSE
jgi:hypothetical protein